MSNNLVVVHGRAYSGKDTIADYLVDKYGFTKIRFADGVYWIAYNIFRMKQKDRRLLQMIGQGGRKIWPNIWVWFTMRKVNKLLSQGKKVIIPDLRQENEYLACRKRDFLIVHADASIETKIRRAKERDNIIPDTSLWERPAETGADKYVSEMVQIWNDGSLQELRDKIDKIMR